MARGRRGGLPPDLRGTLGTLLRSTLEQVGTLKDAALRGAEAQRVWLDGALLQRKHKDALAALGQRVYQRILDGDLRELEADPEIAEAVGQVEEIEVRMEEAVARARETASRARTEAGRAVSSFAARAGFDADRLRRSGADEEPGEVRVWRPVMPDDDVVVDPDDPFDDPPARQPTRPDTPRARVRPVRAARTAGGGIQFVDDGPDEDADLEEYMHPDDVPESKPNVTVRTKDDESPETD